MKSRREFIKQASLIAVSSGIWNSLPESLIKALAINPAPGSTFYDAEHVVILMQENRSFDHSFGSLQGVRGFNDPRAIRQPNGNKVWLQTNKKGQTYAPFRLHLKESKSTWMGSLPHSWSNMVDAHHKGKMDNWLEAKKSGNQAYKEMPLTMGFHNREDIPFYYAMADSFTICDQHFCSSLTGTTPNRVYLWSGTIRHPKVPFAVANVRNSDITYDRNANWRTFPELLEQHQVSWRIYQNELSIDTGFEGEEEDWLANFTNNPLEWFEQYHVKFLETHQRELKKQVVLLEQQIANISGETKEKKEKQVLLQRIKKAIETFTVENFEKLPPTEKNLHQKAFTTNKDHPLYRKVVDSTYDDAGTSRTMKVPAGDVLYEFRKDVDQGTLPAVSWLIPPEHFSDHPGSPWYGAWLISEVMNILTKNPEVWKKTIFIITYDENDGYFDHIPPFVPPSPNNEGFPGKVSAGIGLEEEFVRLSEEIERKKIDQEDARASSIGLGFRVPMIIASPWSRGGKVNSQVFDHTSVLQFLEKFLTKKTGKNIQETNISQWRRTVCGDLTSTFNKYNGEVITYPKPVDKDSFIQSIYNAKFKGLPTGYTALSQQDINLINEGKSLMHVMPIQEKGIRDACALPYQMEVSGTLEKDRKSFSILLGAGKAFGSQSAGIPYLAYANTSYTEDGQTEKRKSWAYAVKPGDQLKGTWPLSNFEKSNYELEVYGPNGFYRLFKGGSGDPAVQVVDTYEADPSLPLKLADKLVLQITNNGLKDVEMIVNDLSYGLSLNEKKIPAGATVKVAFDTSLSHGWYDVSIEVTGFSDFKQQFSGRVETGGIRKTDPVMGKEIA